MYFVDKRISNYKKKFCRGDNNHYLPTQNSKENLLPLRVLYSVLYSAHARQNYCLLNVFSSDYVSRQTITDTIVYP